MVYFLERLEAGHGSRLLLQPRYLSAQIVRLPAKSSSREPTLHSVLRYPRDRVCGAFC